MSTLNELKAARGVAIDELLTLVKNPKAYAKKEAEIKELESEIELTEAARRRSASLATPFSGGNGGGDGDPNKFKNFGEMLQAVARFSTGRGMDKRLEALTRAPAGMGETDPSAGGFPMQPDFADTILTRVYDLGEVVSRCRRVQISPTANGIKIPGIDETSRATGSRWGGVQAFWVGEGDAAAASKPKFRLIELDLKKLMAIWYVTDELLQDAPALTSIANEAFSEEVTFMLENAIVRGTGAGQPQGYLNAACAVQVPIEKGQAAQTILYQNLLNMWSRMWARSRFDAVWYINQDVERQLYQVNQVIGTAGVPVYMPPGGISEKPYATLFGRPVIPTEYSATLGTPGDISLVDMSQYVVADKNAMQQAVSIHVQFLTDQTAFRLTYRCDGQPIWQAPLTPFQGTQTKSPFITLAAR
jgi:HK97 family phage major capsid protein